MKIFDHNFFYQHSIRSILVSKHPNIRNYSDIPTIPKITLSFPLKHLEDIDEVQVHNYLYLFKFFFGRRAFSTRTKSFYNSGKWTYSFSVSLIIKRHDVYKILFTILNDIIRAVENNYIGYGTLSRDLKISYIILKDVTIFGEKKTNLGLFSLKSSLSTKLHCIGADFYSTQISLRNLKIKYNF